MHGTLLNVLQNLIVIAIQGQLQIVFNYMHHTCVALRHPMPQLKELTNFGMSVLI